MYFLYRGEKLYVTKDNRSKPEGKGCRKCFCGTFGVIFLVAAIIVAGLVGGRVIMFNSRCYLCSRKTPFFIQPGLLTPNPSTRPSSRTAAPGTLKTPTIPDSEACSTRTRPTRTTWMTTMTTTMITIMTTDMTMGMRSLSPKAAVRSFAKF